MPTVQLKYQTFHPSIWPKMIGDVSRDAKPGDLVEVIGKQGTRFGWGLWNPKARMPLRIVSHTLDDIDETFFHNAIARAAHLRRNTLKLDQTTQAYRAIHADADFLPGIVADKFADTLSIEITALAAFLRLKTWIPLLHQHFDTHRTIIQIDPDLAKIEAIPHTGAPPSDNIRNIKIIENNTRYQIDFTAGHKTGFFCDQRDNRQKFAHLAKNKTVLDLCCYTGGFSISAALAGAAETTAIDLDENAINLAKRNANLNQAKIKFTHADAFTWIRTMIENQRKWDLIMLDPPKLIHSKDDEIGHAKYHDLNKLALQLLAKDGLLITCSCSGQLPAEDFENIVTNVAHRQNKRLQIIDRTGAGPDHPTLSNYPESRYLKALWTRVIH